MVAQRRTTLAVFRERGDWGRKLSSLGVDVRGYPLIGFKPIKDFEPRLQERWGDWSHGGPGYLLFTSPRAVERFSEIITRPSSSNRDVLSSENSSRVISVGRSTTKSLNGIGIHPQHVLKKEDPEGQEGVWRLIHREGLTPIIHVRPLHIRDFLEKKLKEYGYGYEGYPTYETLPLSLREEEKEELLTNDYLFFTSSSIVEAFHENFRSRLGGGYPAVILIGEPTRKIYEHYFSLRKVDRLLEGDPGEEMEARLLKTLSGLDHLKPFNDDDL